MIRRTNSLGISLFHECFCSTQVPLVSPFEKQPIRSHHFQRQTFPFSRQKVFSHLEEYERQLSASKSVEPRNISRNQSNENSKEESLIRDYLELTEQSFGEHLSKRATDAEESDPHVLLMILSSLSDEQLIRKQLPRLYDQMHLLEKEELLLLMELIVSYKPKKLPSYLPVSRSLNQVETILLLMNQIYQPEKLIDWLRQIPIYKGENVYMVAAGFMAIVEKMDEAELSRNEHLIHRICDRIVALAEEQSTEVQAGLVILALESPQTAFFGERLLVEIELQLDELDPYKKQLLFLSVQRHLSGNYAELRDQLEKKSSYRVVEEDSSGGISESEAVTFDEDIDRDYSRMDDLEKYEFLLSVCENLVHSVLDLNWEQNTKLHLLLEYWRLIGELEAASPWTNLVTRIVSHSSSKSALKAMLNLDSGEILTILEGMDRLKLSNGQLLHRCLMLLSDKLEGLQKRELIRLCRVCVTYVRQCEDYLIGLRNVIERRKFAFDSAQIKELNQLFGRVLVLFPNPL